METIIKCALIVLLAVYNLITFFVYGYDKKCAIKNKRRISEKQLIIMVLCFGGVGGFLGMKIFRHKTKHLQFQILIPLFLSLQIIISVILTIYI